MSDKEVVIDLIHHLPENATVTDILAALHDRLALELPPSAQENGDEGSPAQDLTDEEWMATIAEDWAEDLGDPRQDAHAKEHGVSPDEPW